MGTSSTSPRRRGWGGPTATPTRFIFGCTSWGSMGSGCWCPLLSSSMPANTSQLPSVPTTAPGRRHIDPQDPFGPDPKAPQPSTCGPETLGSALDPTQDLCSPLTPGPRTPGPPWSQRETPRAPQDGGKGQRWVGGGFSPPRGAPKLGSAFCDGGLGPMRRILINGVETEMCGGDGVGVPWCGRGSRGKLWTAEVGVGTPRRKRRRGYALSDSGGAGSSCQPQPMGN